VGGDDKRTPAEAVPKIGTGTSTEPASVCWFLECITMVSGLILYIAVRACSVRAQAKSGYDVREGGISDDSQALGLLQAGQILERHVVNRQDGSGNGTGPHHGNRVAAEEASDSVLRVDRLGHSSDRHRLALENGGTGLGKEPAPYGVDREDYTPAQDPRRGGAAHALDKRYWLPPDQLGNTGTSIQQCLLGSLCLRALLVPNQCAFQGFVRGVVHDPSERLAGGVERESHEHSFRGYCCVPKCLPER
jgi:hypothetical protein